MAKIPRGNNFTLETELRLAQIILPYKNVVENKTTNLVSPAEKEVAWGKIMDQFNSCHGPRTVPQLKSKYDNLKTAARKYYASQKKHLYGTGGGAESTKDKRSIVYEVILEIVNIKTVGGLENPYDDDVCVMNGGPPTPSGTITSAPTQSLASPTPIPPLDNLKYGEIIYCEPDYKTPCEADDKTPYELEDKTPCEAEAPIPSTSNWGTYTPTMLKRKRNGKLAPKKTNVGAVGGEIPEMKAELYRRKLAFAAKEEERQARRMEMDEEQHRNKLEMDREQHQKKMKMEDELHQQNMEVLALEILIKQKQLNM